MLQNMEAVPMFLSVEGGLYADAENLQVLQVFATMPLLLPKQTEYLTKFSSSEGKFKKIAFAHIPQRAGE